jgi:RNA polymerase sigma-70 factor (ECF subfamily)
MEGLVSEADLLAQARTGNPRAFDLLLAPHRDRLWGVCLRVTGNAADAEDALQECLLAVWQNLARFRGEARLSTWLYRIASNAAIGVVRRRREFATEIEETADPRSGIAERVADQDQVQRALRLIPEDFRVALVLREYGDFTYEEIAAHQGILVQTVKSRLNRARAALREALSEV